MLYATGDLHGDLGRFKSRELRRLRKGDTLFVCDRLEDIGLVTPPEDLFPFSITAGPRVGIDYAEEAVDFPWRYQVAPESHLI